MPLDSGPHQLVDLKEMTALGIEWELRSSSG